MISIVHRLRASEKCPPEPCLQPWRSVSTTRPHKRERHTFAGEKTRSPNLRYDRLILHNALTNHSLHTVVFLCRRLTEGVPSEPSSFWRKTWANNLDWMCSQHNLIRNGGGFFHAICKDEGSRLQRILTTLHRQELAVGKGGDVCMWTIAPADFSPTTPISGNSMRH